MKFEKNVAIGRPDDVNFRNTKFDYLIRIVGLIEDDTDIGLKTDVQSKFSTHLNTSGLICADGC